MPQRVLIIEDDPESASLMTQVLSIFGFDVEIAVDGESGLRLFAERQPDAVLLDLGLPDMPGITILRKLSENPVTADIPILIVSSDDSEEARIICMSSGAHDFIQKPLKAADVATRVQNAVEYLDQKRQLKALNQKLTKDKLILARYFSSDFVEKILAEEIPTELGKGRLVDASVMFFDIRDSTSIAERIGPSAYTEFINRLFSVILDIIADNGGSINELLGDGVIATFGVPTAATDDAPNALRASLAIRQFISDFKGSPTASGYPVIGFGIGLASGMFFAGNVGSVRRIKFAVMGDPVNLAARIQGLTKKLLVDIAFDGVTRARLSADFDCRKLGVTRVRGKSELTALFTPAV